ncbi:MAG TPA: hypothetical protein ENJ82_15085 [Bacteroidetes bacterium]|nr:hypothetical protein [Bacteroidota bacterium]
MRKSSLFLAYLFSFMLAACGSATVALPEVSPVNKFAADSVFITIADGQDRRKPTEVLPFLGHEDSTYREAAALAFGSLQDSFAVPNLIQLLDDSHVPVARAAAYAIGQTRHISGATPLLAKLRSRPAPALAASLGAAIGKCGDSTHLAQLMGLYAGNASLDRALAGGLFQFALRKMATEKAAKLALKLVSSKDAEAQKLAAAFLARARNLAPFSDVDGQALIASYRALSNADVQQHLIRAFGRCTSAACSETLLAILEDEASDYRIRINAILAMQKQPKAEFLPAMQKLAVGENSHLAVSAVRYLYGQTSPADALDFLALSAKQAHWRPKAMLLGAGLKVYSGRKRDAAAFKKLVKQVHSRFLETQNIYEKGELLVALAEDAAQEDFLIAQMLKKEKVVSVFAMQALDQFYGATSTAQNASTRLKTLQTAIETGDVAIMALAAGRIRNTAALREAVRDTTFLKEALNRLDLPAEIEIYNAFEATLAAIRGETLPAPTPAPWGNPIDWEFVQQIPKDLHCIFLLKNGEIRLRLRVEDAPGSVANFVKLGLDGFYDGAALHRVVPNFVAQGGDPRGDGWGSGPQTIRSEWPNLHYNEGSVGLASAGKDTESCQWFISHCSTPHLDGRYTIFAEVVSGMELVHKLQIGDQIIQVTFPGFSVN